MLTSTRHKKRMLEYLKVLYTERQNFNNKVLELKNKKINILNKLVEYKKIMDEYNQELNVDETYDWYNFINNDKVDDLMKIPENELNEYMKTKILEDEKLKKLFKMEGEPEKEGEEKEKEPEKKNSSKVSLDKEELVTENKEKKEDEEEEEDWNFEPRIRENKQTNDTNLQFEYTKINELKYNYKKQNLLKEINKLIDDFDNELYELKSERCSVTFFQKLG